MRISVKLAPTFTHAELEQFWRHADALGFEAVWDYDHFYGLSKNSTPTLEGWTTLAAMAVVVRRARIGCMVTGVHGHRSHLPKPGDPGQDGGLRRSHLRWPA